MMHIFDKRSTHIAIHILIWGLLLLLPVLFTYSDAYHNSLQHFLRSSIPLAIAIVIFYINYFMLIDRYFFNGKVIYFLLGNLLLIFGAIVLSEYLRTLFPSQDPTFKPFDPPKALIYFRLSLIFILTIGASMSLRVTGRWQKTEREKKMLENEHLKTEITHLKYQLQPHFFFNTLNNIYALVDTAPDKAKDSIHKLSKMMRYLLYEANTETIKLSKEIEFLRHYIELMKIRTPDHVKVTSDFPGKYKDFDVVPLLFIALVENAFKHGTSASKPSFIHIQLELFKDHLLFFTENSNLPKNEDDRSGSGIGLENLQKRLDLIFKDQYLLKTENNKDFFRIYLKVPT